MKRRSSQSGLVGVIALVFLCAGWTAAVVLTHKPMSGLKGLGAVSASRAKHAEAATTEPGKADLVATTAPEAETMPSSQAADAPTLGDKPVSAATEKPAAPGEPKIPAIPALPSFGQ